MPRNVVDGRLPRQDSAESWPTTIPRNRAGLTSAPAEMGGVRLCPDEWMADLGFDIYDSATRADVDDSVSRFEAPTGDELASHGQSVAR